MSRVTEIVSFVKKDLGQYNQRDINTAQIYYAINKGQESIIMTEGFLFKKITIDVVAGLLAGTTDTYPLVYGATPQAIVKRVVSAVWPDTWAPIQWKTPQQFDDLKTIFNAAVPDYGNPTGYQNTLTYPLFCCIRGGNIEFLGPPQDPTGVTFTLGVLLSKQSKDADDTYDPEVPSQYDTALRFFADWFLLPIDNPARVEMWDEFDLQVKRYEGILNDTDSFSRSPEPTW